MIKKIEIDETKLPEVMRMIDAAAVLMAEKDCDSDEGAKQELIKLEQDLRDITGNHDLKISDFRRYWSAVDLKTVARGALMQMPPKENLTDAEIKEIAVNILNRQQAEMDWWLNYLRVNTGLDNLTDYIFFPIRLGLRRTQRWSKLRIKLSRTEKVEELIGKISIYPTEEELKQHGYGKNCGEGRTGK